MKLDPDRTKVFSVMFEVKVHPIEKQVYACTECRGPDDRLAVFEIVIRDRTKHRIECVLACQECAQKYVDRMKS